MVVAFLSMPLNDQVIAAFNKVLAQSKQDGSHASIVQTWDERMGLDKLSRL